MSGLHHKLHTMPWFYFLFCWCLSCYSAFHNCYVYLKIFTLYFWIAHNKMKNSFKIHSKNRIDRDKMNTPKIHIHDRSLSLLVTVAELSKLYDVWGYDNLYKLNWRMKTSSSLKKLSNIWKRKYIRCGFTLEKKRTLCFTNIS